MAFAERLGNFIWNPWLLGLFLLSGLYFSVRTGFFQLFHVRLWLKTTLGSLLRPKRRREGGGLTQLQALSTALASTIGTGSIAGVATAIFYGGPGAVFWMWVSAFLGMMTGCVEKTLAVRYREKSRDGGWQGGPMCYMERGVGSRTLAALFSLCCVAASLGGGNVVQANSIAASLEANPEDPKALLSPIPSALPASFDEVISPTQATSAPAWHPLGTTDEAGAQTANAQQASAPADAATQDPAEAALDAAATRVEAAPASVPQASPEPRTETAMRGIPVVEAEDPALAESEVSDLVVRARKILSDLPGSIAPQE